MKKLAALVFLFFDVLLMVGQEQAFPVFQAGQEGYKSYRIPAVIQSPNGDLLAFAEGRKGGVADFGNNDILLKRSQDGGKIWSAIHVVVDNGEMQASNAAPVVDMTDPNYPDGRIFLFYNTGSASEQELRKGNGKRQVWYKTSIDNGITWSAPENITTQVKKSHWRTYANTPGHGMQFQYGKYKGRIYIAANHSAGDPKPGYKDYQSHGFYTDDHGKSFHLSEAICFLGSNESTAAPLSNGRLMMNMRNQSGTPSCRIVAISKNGGETWDKIYYEHNLPDPTNQGSLLNIGTAKNLDVLAFTNTADTLYRRNLTLRISFDGGQTWAKNILVDKKNAGTMYSDIVKLGKNKIGVLYERKRYTEIVFKSIDWQK